MQKKNTKLEILPLIFSKQSIGTQIRLLSLLTVLTFPKRTSGGCVCVFVPRGEVCVGRGDAINGWQFWLVIFSKIIPLLSQKGVTLDFILFKERNIWLLLLEALMAYSIPCIWNAFVKCIFLSLFWEKQKSHPSALKLYTYVVDIISVATWLLMYVRSYLGRDTRSPAGGTARWLSPDPAELLLCLPAWFSLVSVEGNHFWVLLWDYYVTL